MSFYLLSGIFADGSTADPSPNGFDSTMISRKVINKCYNYIGNILLQIISENDNIN